MDKERKLEFSDPNEQLELAALVNRFCELEAEEFDADIHLQPAREIVQALDPRIEKSSEELITVSTNINLPNSSPTILGATEAGEVETRVKNNDGKRKGFKKIIGKKKEYRIGAYVITNTSYGNTNVLAFKNFWGHGGSNEALGVYPPFWTIEYNKKDLGVKQITKYYPYEKSISFSPLKTGFSLILEHKYVVWKAKRSK